MTDTSSIQETHSTVNLFPVSAPTLPSPVANGNGSTNEAGDEPYTIKCICAFEDDDGSTVFCERCETWQHIVCYYNDESVPEIHNCTDCEPRVLDGKRATERQRRLREQSDNDDRKTKRSGSKGQKKKTKDHTVTGELPNGWPSHERSASTASARDHPPPAKKQRTHRSSNSVGSLSGGTGESRKRTLSSNAVATTNPPKSPFHPQIPLYSHEYLHLYDNDQASVDMQSNLFDTIGLAGDLALWAQDPVALSQVANGRTAKDVFTYVDHPLESSKWPPISRQSAVDTNIEFDGKHPTWRFLKVENHVPKDEIVGEVRGKVGHFRDYCLDPNSRWQELRHPEPFVFFHPQLPIYIDSRKEGTELRYIRRSCRPNVTLKTFITNEVEYHFCFVANQDIPVNSEITATWYLDPQMFPSSNGIVKQEGSNEGIPDSAAISISNVLAHFGGCACDPSKPCLLANVDCRIKPKEANAKQTNGRKRKAKSKVAKSPDGVGHTSNSRSRSTSEAVKNQEEDGHTDNRSVSGSLKDQPRSRGLTPTRQGSADTHGPEGTELSVREQRKIAAAEKKFEQLEHGQHQGPKRKKKANAARAHSPASNANQTKLATISSSLTKPSRLDTSLSRRSTTNSPSKMSPSSPSSRREGHLTPPKVSHPNTPRVASPLSRHPAYVDSAMQTDPDENDPQYVPSKPSVRPQYIPLTKRLLKRCYEDRVRLEKLGLLKEPKSVSEAMPPPPSTPGSNASINNHASSPNQPQEDVEMKDADTSITPPKPQQPPTTSNTHFSPIQGVRKGFPFQPLPSTVAHSMPAPSKPPEYPKGNLRVQLPPPNYQNSSSTTSPIISDAGSPTTTQKSYSPKPQTTHGGPQNSASSVTAPSPAKKKLTLNDYMSRRGTLGTPTTEKTHNPFLPTSQLQSSPTSTNSAPSSGNGDPTSAQLPFTKAADGAVKPELPSTVDVVMKDAYLSTSTSTHTEPSPQNPLSSRDPRLQPRT